MTNQPLVSPASWRSATKAIRRGVSSARGFALAGFLFAMLAGQARAIPVSWGSEIPSVLCDSYGNSLNASFYMQLGYFEGTFTPDANNTSQWAANWRVFDQASVPGASFDPVTGYFARESIAIDENGQSQSEFADLGLNFTGKDAYLWTYNNKTPGVTTEWFLARSTSWVFPQGSVAGCCENELPLQWSVSDLATITPVWGAQGTYQGSGYHTNTGSYTFQTFTFVPEPSSAMMVLLGASAALLYRRRSMPVVRVDVSLLIGILAIGIAAPCHAERIHWFGPAHKSNQTSDGAEIQQDMVFELGLFTDGFVPTADNAGEWSSHWLAAQRADYSSEGRRFAGEFVVTETSSPFTGGKQAYIWGFRGGLESCEWILLYKDTWKWPVLAADQAAEMRNPLSALEWNAAQATAIVGKLQPTALPYLMQTASIANVASPKTSWAQWVASNMNGETRNGLLQDPDGDGVNNLMEYVFGSLPSKASPPPAIPMELVTVGTDKFMQVTIPRRIDHTANLVVEVSSDLQNWHSGADTTVTVSDTPAGWVVRDKVPHDPANPKRFVRVRAEVSTP